MTRAANEASSGPKHQFNEASSESPRQFDDTDTSYAKPFDASDPFDVALVRWAQGNTVWNSDLLFSQTQNKAAEAPAHRLVLGDLDPHPFATAASFIESEIGNAIEKPVSENQVLTRLAQWKADGTMRRFGAAVRHRNMGYTHNGMTVWNVPDEAVEAVGKAFSGKQFVSHCYERPRTNTWPYNMYAMCHAKSEQELNQQVETLQQCALNAAAVLTTPLVLESEKEYKKSSMRYFEERQNRY